MSSQHHYFPEINARTFNPMNDVAFKFIFGKEERKDITIAFLNAVLSPSLKHEIKDIVFQQTELAPENIAGLRSFPEKVILIAGGYDKHIPYDVLGPEICQHVKKLFLGGATGEKIRKAVEAAPEYRPGETEITDCGASRTRP